MRDNIVILSRPGYSAKEAKIDEAIVHSDYTYPKSDITRRPRHIDTIDLDWTTSGITIPFGEERTYFSMPHGYDGIPTIIGAYRFTRPGTEDLAGMLPLQMGALGMWSVDADEKNVNLKYISIDFGGTAIPVFRMFVRFYVFAERGLVRGQ